MTKQKKSSRGLYPQMGNNRWKWMAGATAATAAGVTASQASAMTINLLNNYISAFGGNHLNADLTGDGHPDLTISGSRISHFGHYVGYTYLYAGTARVVLNGVPAYAMFSTDYHVAGVALGSRTAHSLYGSAASLTGSIPIFFKDLHINNGTPTKGSLEVTVSAAVGGTAKVQLDSLTYTNPASDQRSNSVLDEGSSLALLAMGAGGVLGLRWWRAAQERS